ncbi:AAA family ATPase [Rhodococcus sp. BP-252]|uniref:RNA polymerase recycling motor ATPase HelR n=1 Tax=unclassified Rhodococcus (in: high G+C Gram-positive bacteria) TaxID=192944 RepID=UPI0014303B14|nr:MULTISPECIES: RNA polymerase recycling motor ATPase HelR [unclassified Rhodococcus (in: high G+C Gram-positive bacteria)]MBY6410118.1 AAA family ATPase [Rhodococcus sp. BP-320]MBY6415087.1 AAA family ATPase [Rhodococcus sp. BP-321]MBY6421410.1 AAA family ATPase [Rhodococcus sp. BP-324]MBY6425605.1 AAA family ATPase [Rhodococcus sp. BP-323]MBY6429983.1 AAA family ATPase [Rhodococcus sp. BP-322]
MSGKPQTADSAFDLPAHLRHKNDPTLIAHDEAFFASVAASLERSITDLLARLDATRKAPVEIGREALERDMEVHRLNARIRTMRRYGLDLCLGHIVKAGSGRTVYIGRLGLVDSNGDQLLIDWRSPAAEPFFGATHAQPMGLERRRRYRWTRGRISDYWDEVFTADGYDGPRKAALDDQSAFIASLGGSRSPKMRDVLGTIQADQDAIVRAGSSGALVVDGGPGTGKTVVALHRTAYLLYADPRLGRGHGGVLFVGPHKHYLAYVSDVLPSLGEEGVTTCTLADLVSEGERAVPETDAEVARLKSSVELVRAIDKAVAFYEQSPKTGMTVETEWANIRLTPDDWKEAFDVPDPGTPHNEAREIIWDALIAILMDKYAGDEPISSVRKSLQENDDLRTALDNAWTLIEAADLVGDLWSVPAYLRHCAPWLSATDVRTLYRVDAHKWTTADLPLLDAARARLGDPETARRQRRRSAAAAAERCRMDRVVDELLQLDDEDGLMAQLRQDGIRDALVDGAAVPDVDPDRLAGPFAHVVVDEAQELTDAEWQMLLLRCPSHSFTIVGDRAQARHGFVETWQERLERTGLRRVQMASLSMNYRTPEEVMTVAEPVIKAALPDANVPKSIRRSGIPVVHAPVVQLDQIVDAWTDSNPDGIGCVIGRPAFRARDRISSLSPELAKGLEFDLVVVVDPESFGSGIEGAVDRYVAMTRATQKLVVLTTSGAERC